MAKKRHADEEIVAKLRRVDVLLAQGKPCGGCQSDRGDGSNVTIAGVMSTVGSRATRSNGSRNWR